MPRNTTVRTSSNPVNEREQTVTEPAGTVQIPDEVRNHPAWRRIWQFLLSDPAARTSDDEAA